TSRQYDVFERVVSEIDGNGNTKTTAHDRLGRLITSTAAGGTTSAGYDAFSNVLWQDDATGRRTTYAYDPAARTTTVTTPSGVSVVTTTNRHGETITLVNGNGGKTSYTYDKNGNLLTETKGGVTVSHS